MKRYIDYLIRSEEHRVDEMLFLQIKDKNDLCYGLMRGDVIEAKPTIYMMATALALYLNSRSRYYKSEKLMEALQLAAVIGSIFPVERALKRRFDDQGNRR